MYQYIDATLIRATATPWSEEPGPWPDLTGDSPADVDRWRHWLAQMWSDPLTAEAVELASRSLAERVREVIAGHVQEARQVRRAVVSVVRYLLRMRHRATPFGLFAGVAPARIGPEPVVEWGMAHRVVARPDAVWLAKVIDRLEACPELLRRLPVMVDPTSFVRGGMLVVPFQQQSHDSGSAPGTSRQVTVRLTHAVEAVVQAARLPVPAADLLDKLTADYPDAPAEAVNGLLAGLVSRHVLLTSLRAPMTATDALSHLTGQLAAVRAEEIEAVAPAVLRLDEIHRMLARHNQAPRAAQQEARAAAAGQMAALCPGIDQSAGVDLRLDCTLALPEEVAHEAERATAALARLTPFPSGSPAWRDYHTRFLERYGVGALVPVRELVDPDVGLGFPAGYRGSLLQPPAPQLTSRDERLLALVQQATLDGTREIALDDRMLAELVLPETALSHVPAHAQLCFRLHAPTRAALSDGAFELIVVGLTASAGTTSGRFLHLLEAPDRRRMAAAYADLPTLDPAALPAQLSSPPLRVRTENVSRSPAVLPHVIPLTEHPGCDGTLRLDDLAVGADAQRLYLVSLSQDRAVEPMMLNAVNLPNFTHPLARFLYEIPRARAAVLGTFAWGAARRLPFLPRLRYGRTVLSPARWRLNSIEIAAPSAPRAEWTAALTAWRERVRLPDTVFLGDDDQRLHLDLRETAHLQLLRNHLDHAGHATLHEAATPEAYGWLDGRAHEISMALATGGQSTSPRPPRRARPVAAIGREHGHLPGVSPWAFAKLYGHPDRVPEILTAHLPRLLQAWDSPPEWWYVRYRDPDPHLRLRLRLPHPDAYGQAAQRFGAWTADLRRLGLVSRLQWDTYYPETGRYGTGAAMAAAEALFVADSAASVAELEFTPHPAVTAASFLDLAASFLTGTADAMRWLIKHIDASTGPAHTRHVRALATRLTPPHDQPLALRVLPGGAVVADAWQRRWQAAGLYRDRLLAFGGPEPQTVLPSLLHMHHIRTAGIDEECERACRRLARSLALSWTARFGGTQP